MTPSLYLCLILNVVCCVCLTAALGRPPRAAHAGGARAQAHGPARPTCACADVAFGAGAFTRFSEHFAFVVQTASVSYLRSAKVGLLYLGNANLAHRRPEYVLGSRCYSSFFHPSDVSSRCVVAMVGDFCRTPHKIRQGEGLGNSSSPKPRCACAREVRITWSHGHFPSPKANRVPYRTAGTHNAISNRSLSRGYTPPHAPRTRRPGSCQGKKLYPHNGKQQ